MRQLITIVLFMAILLPFCTQAQELDYDMIVKSKDDVESFEEYLVYLAWLNNPNAGLMEHRQNIANIQIKEAKLGVWETITPFVNYNFGITNNTGTQVVSGTPSEVGSLGDGRSRGLGMGVSFRLLPLFATKHRVAIAKETAKMVVSDVNTNKLNLRAQVLGRYVNYIYAQKTVEERAKTESDASENMRLVLELFKKDLAEFEDVNNASSTYHKAVEERLRSELETRSTKILVEELIGISLEEALLTYDGSEDLD